MRGMPIGKLSTATGVKVPTIRYYEQIGLLPSPPRTPSNRRLYGKGDIQRVRFIRRARELGFEIPAIRTLLALQDDPRQPCDTADVIARHRLAEIEQRIASLTALKQELERMLHGCSHREIAHCRVIEVLADHGQCLREHVTF